MTSEQNQHVKRQTDRAKYSVMQAVQLAKSLVDDIHKEKRISQQLCLHCFYVLKAPSQSNIVDSFCSVCQKPKISRSQKLEGTTVCDDCSHSLNLCKRCASEVDLSDAISAYTFKPR